MDPNENVYDSENPHDTGDSYEDEEERDRD
ncbi:Uncharacterised protein [Mycobacteroides abscessus subsp. abscessus]|nr:Uncharacterised protein [Mycobacteroides abscessus subsp. abscessus]SIF38743.1 Uncharacterised protein [Mycobacteroides abscessus subsp. abscessus]SIF83666.1 Uncharacterised protein [Mycobacteroides abscessus subsp. abscessus]